MLLEEIYSFVYGHVQNVAYVFAFILDLKNLVLEAFAVADNDKVLVTVITDGYENASVEYSGTAIKALVEELRAKGWVITYIGANQDVEKVASAISVTNVMDFQSTHAGTSDMFCKERRARARWFDRLSKGISEVDGDFFKEE